MSSIWRTYIRRFLYSIGVPRVFSGIRQSTIGPYGTAVLTETKNGVLLVPVTDAFVGRALCFKGCYDYAILEFLLSQCSSRSNVLVVGAHVGAFAIPLAKKVNHVSAIEANPYTYELLRLNSLLNGLRNIDTYTFAAGDKNADINFVATRMNTGGSRLKSGDWNWWSHVCERPQTVTIPMKKLDDVFPDSSFDLIVMDIEGSEALALRGMQSLLNRSSALVIEIVEDHLRRIANVSNDEFLQLIKPHFEQAIILPEGTRDKRTHPDMVYPRSSFDDVLQRCCNRDVVANVYFHRVAVGHEHTPNSMVVGCGP